MREHVLECVDLSLVCIVYEYENNIQFAVTKCRSIKHALPHSLTQCE